MSAFRERFLPSSPLKRPRGIAALSVFFALGVIPSAATALALAFPGRLSEAMWRLKPEAPADFARLGHWAIPLMISVALACGGAAIGLWRTRRWGHRLAVGLLAANVVGDTLNAVIRGDWRSLIGLMVGGALLAYLLNPRTRTWFAGNEERHGSPASDAGTG